ncbi:MAG: hypothetical protein GQ582_03965, partial [Methyloprofundus sp.]|nr:hypothetical protein [Methyloprofundus sp.]
MLGLCVASLASYASVAAAENMHQQKHQKKLDKKLSAIIMQNGLTGNPLLNRTVPDISSAQAQLGKDLFFSKSLGGDFDSACVACHHPSLGGGDNLS